VVAAWTRFERVGGGVADAPCQPVAHRLGGDLPGFREAPHRAYGPPAAPAPRPATPHRQYLLRCRRCACHRSGVV